MDTARFNYWHWWHIKYLFACLCYVFSIKSQHHFWQWILKLAMAAMMFLKQQRRVLRPIEQKRSLVAPLLWRCKHTQWCSSTMQRHFIPSFLLSPFSESGGEHEAMVVPGGHRSYVRKFSFPPRSNSYWDSVQSSVLSQSFYISS